MDWLEEKADRFWQRIRNLSFRKAMIAYILVLAAIVWGLSYLTMILCWQWEMNIWAEYGETENLKAVIYEKGLLWGYGKGIFLRLDEKKLLLFDICRVWCPYFYAFAGIIITIFIFYRKRLKRPLSILEESVERIREDDLDFCIAYNSNDELGRLCDSVEAMRLELISGKKEMWRLIERQKELNAAFAHDLRTPLTVLRGYTDFLARYIPEGKVSAEKLESTLGLMTEHLKRLEEYSRTMKGIRSIEEVPFSPEQTELRSIQRKISEVVFALNQIKDVKIFYEENDSNRAIAADDGMIMEVLENMLSNSIRYAREKIEVMSDYDEVRKELLLTVRDDGPGFSEEQLIKALKPYYKEHEKEEPDEHFGIGLHICRELCRKHGGTLNVANSIKGGAVVTASFAEKFV